MTGGLPRGNEVQVVVLLVVVLEALSGVHRTKAELWWSGGVVGWGGESDEARVVVITMLQLLVATSLVSAPAASDAHHTARPQQAKQQWHGQIHRVGRKRAYGGAWLMA